MNTTPPNLKRQAGREPTGVEQLNVGLEASHIYVEAMPFDFTELFLSDEEIDQMCVIPSREPKGLIARWMPAQRPVSGGRRSTRPLQAVIAAGMAWLALPGCSCGNAQVEAPTAEVRIEAVRTVTALRVAVQAEAAGRIARHEAAPEARREAVEAPHQARAAHVAVRPASMLAEFAMLDQAKTAIDAGHYKEALGIYKHLLYRQPTHVDALFGAALASHELRDSRGSDVYLKRALTLAPNHPLANILAGFTDQMGHHYQAAREHYGRFLSVEGQGERADEIRAVLASLPGAAGGTVTGGR